MKILRYFIVFSVLTLSTAATRNTTKAMTGAGTGSTESNSKNDRILLKSITALVFADNTLTRSSLGSRKPQLHCVGGSASGFWWSARFYPHQVQCRNVGWDGSSIQWSCMGQLRDEVMFGPKTAVICEPYHVGNDDGYILRGSCHLEYTLNFKIFHITFVHVIYGTLPSTSDDFTICVKSIYSLIVNAFIYQLLTFCRMYLVYWPALVLSPK